MTDEAILAIARADFPECETWGRWKLVRYELLAFARAVIAAHELAAAKAAEPPNALNAEGTEMPGASQEGRTALPAATATQCGSEAAERAAFERWASSEGYVLARRGDGDIYADGETMTAWIAWDAALAARSDVIDLDAATWDSIKQAASESTWMPPEYYMNDWVADVIRWLKHGPPESTAPPTALEAQQEGAMPPALVERGIERRKHMEQLWEHNGMKLFSGPVGMKGQLNRRIKDRRRA